MFVVHKLDKFISHLLLEAVQKRITTHYSAAELQNLLNASNKVCNENSSGSILVMLRTMQISGTAISDLQAAL